MRRIFFAVVTAILAWWTLVGMRAEAQWQQATPAALEGLVRSHTETPMEGVLVSAKRVGGNITITVVSDSKGRYVFPKNKLQPGPHTVSIRAAGYDLASPSAIDIFPNKTAKLDLKLAETRDLGSQLSNAEWLMSFPGKPEQIEKIYNCVGCHSLTTVSRSKYSGDSWFPVLHRMRNYGPGGIKRPQKLPYEVPPGPPDEGFDQFLSSINLSSGDNWEYPLKTLPRPKGRATRVVITEYDLPNKVSHPHEIVLDPEGMVWYADFVLPFLYKMDPRTGELREYRIPDVKPGFPVGSNCLELDKKGNLWMAMLKQAGIARFDRKTEQFTTWKLPAADNVRAHSGCVIIADDGTVWAEDTGTMQVHRLDPKTGRFTNYVPFPDNKTIIHSEAAQGYMGGARERRHSMYGPALDLKGTYYVADIGAGHIVKIDPETKAVSLYATPTPYSGPRRMDMDSQDRLWFAEYYAGKIGMFDTKTSNFREWSIPTPYAGPYDVMVDKNGEVWGGGMHTDFVYRLDPNTGQVTQYLLPTVNANIRNMGGVDNRTTPVTVWVGENHQAKIAKSNRWINLTLLFGFISLPAYFRRSLRNSGLRT